MAATGLTAGTWCVTYAGASGNGLGCRRLCGSEVVVGMTRMRRRPATVSSTRCAAGAVATWAVAGSCGSDMATMACIYLPETGVGGGFGASEGVLNLLLYTRIGARPPDGIGTSAANRYVTRLHDKLRVSDRQTSLFMDQSLLHGFAKHCCACARRSRASVPGNMRAPSL